MEYYIKVLLVDDDPRYAKGIQDMVYRENKIELTHYEDWDEARSELFENPNKYSYVVLDAYGRLNRGEAGDNPKHVMKAITEINKSGNNIEYFILTAYKEEVSKFVPDDEKIFKKNKEEKLLFSTIAESFKGSDKMIVGRNYPVALSYIEAYFTDEQIKYFVNLYLKIEEKRDDAGIMNEFGRLRILNERNMDNLGLLFEGFSSVDEYIQHIKKTNPRINRGSRTIGILDYFSEKIQKVPSGIYSNTKGLYYAASSSGSHSPIEDLAYTPSNHQLLCFKYGLLEAIEWVGNLIESKSN